VDAPVARRTELLLLRHGIAQEREAGCVDAERALTDRGRRRTEAVARRLVELGLGVDRLLSSPLLRARQTAEIAAAAGLAPALELTEALAPGADPLPQLQAWWPTAIPAGPGPRRLGVVGHEPDLGRLAARLIGAPAGAIALRKAGVALLELHEAGGAEGTAVSPASLRLLLSPRVLLG
jgi:phosphohistidine phosphatase